VENFEYLWEFYFPSLMLFALSFPRESPILRRVPLIGFLLFFPYIFHLAVMMFGDRMLSLVTHVDRLFPAAGEVSVGSRELAVGGIDNVIDVFVRMLEKVHRNMFSVVNIIYASVAIVLLARNFGRLLNPRLASQLRTVLAGLSVGITGYVVAKFFSWTYPDALPRDAHLALVNLSLVASGGTIAFAVIRQQFLGIRNVMRRSILYSAAAIVIAVTYLVVVRPISDFFGQYSEVSKDAFETGFLILTIIAFQPTLVRTEELLGSILLKGREGTTRRFKKLAGEVAAVTSLEELEEVLRTGFRSILDTATVALHICQEGSYGRLRTVLEAIGEPVQRKDLANFERVAEGERKGKLLRKRITPRRRGHRSLLDEILEESSEIAAYEIVVPITKDRRCVGFVGLGEKIYGVPYSTEELAHLSVLAEQIAAALQSISLIKESLERKLLEEELKIARKIQTQLLPGAPPELEGFDLCAVTVPSRVVGGDYYDYVLIDDRWLALVVADVSGKGIPASILTATLQGAIRSNADIHTDPERMLARLNKLLFRNTSASEFATLFYGVVDLRDGGLRYANAGHDFPFVLGGGAKVLPESDIVLGCLEDFRYRSFTSEVPAGGALVIYTDGVTDSESDAGDYFGAARLQAVLERHADRSAREICRCVIDEVQAFGKAENQDDLTLVVLRREAT
jgi:serine phosphatase RsbU (regulator of sigma subunit)